MGKLRDHFPLWAAEPFLRFSHSIDDLHNVLHLSVHGITDLVRLSTVEELFAEIEKLKLGLDNISDVANRRIEHAEHLAKLAKKEVERGFPLILSHTVTSICSSLESFVYEFLANWIQHDEKTRKGELVREIRISLTLYEDMEEEERYQYIVNQLLDSRLPTNPKGLIDKFEMLLTNFGISGETETEVRKKIREMIEIRNVIVHRKSIVDRRLTEACPWLELRIGEVVTVTQDDYVRYHDSAYKYNSEVMRRVARHFGVEGDVFDEHDDCPMCNLSQSIK